MGRTSAFLSPEATYGDGAPTIKIKGSADVEIDAQSPFSSPTIKWRNCKVKMTVKKSDDGWNGDPYMSVNQSTRMFNFGKTSKIDGTPISKKCVESSGSSWTGYLDDFDSQCFDSIYFKNAGEYYTPTFTIKSEFWREKIVRIKGPYNYTLENSDSIQIPVATRLFETGNGSSLTASADSHIYINNRWMYKIPNGTYAGCPATLYGNRSLDLSVVLTTNGTTNVSVIFRPDSGNTITFSKTTGKMSGELHITGSAYFQARAYHMTVSTDGGSISGAIRIKARNPGFTSSSGIICFYAPGSSYAPPNSNPSFTVTNTTPEQVSTAQTKSVSLAIHLNDNGVSRYWLNQMKYNVDLYWNDGTKIGSYQVNDSDMNNLNSHTTNFSTTVQVRTSKRQQDEYVYWVVSGYSVDTAGVTRWGTTQTSGKVNLFWAYVEPSLVTFNSSRISTSSGPNFTNNRAQLYYGGTTLSFVLQGTINAWGDRPGSRNYEFSLNHGSPVKYFGKNVTSDTGAKSHTYTYTIPDSWVGSTSNFTIYKRLDNTEYLASGNPKSPAIGTNHASGGTISFYETIGGVSGMIDIKPSILMLTIPASITGQGVFDKQSSQKVRYYVEIYDLDTSRVISQYPLGNTVGDITKQVTIDLSSANFTVPEAHLYELRLKADVTELLGNVHTYTFYTTNRLAFYPPRYTLAETTTELLPPTSDSSLLIRQKATNTYSYMINYDLVLSSSILYIEYYLASSPTVKRIKTVNIIPSSYSGGVFYGEYTLPNPSELDPSDPLYDAEGFALGTKVTAYISSTWNLPGSTSIYSNSSGKIYYDVTPTRYNYFLTRFVEDEQWLNTIHSITPTRADKKSKKIFVSTDIS